MGIPMFREPSSSEAPKSTLLKDPTAAARSSIRRQPTIRRPSRHANGASRGTLDRHISLPFPRAVVGHASARDLADRFPSAENNSVNLRAPLDARRRQASQRLLVDTARHDQPTPPRLRVLSHLFQQDAAQGQQNSEPHPPYTPRFAPAIAYHSTLSPHPPPYEPVIPSPRMDSSGDGLGMSRLPQIRRVGERQMSDFDRANSTPIIDGLGDRERSLSPENDDQAHNAWETLLTTITPDANLPSNESSFASTSAPATNASRSGTALTSTNSSQTHPSLPDPGDFHMILDYPDFLNPCDYLTSSDSDSDPELDLESSRPPRRQRRPRSHFMDSLRQSHEHNSTMSSQPPIPTISLSFHDSTSDPDLQQMQAILDRLVHREDIPDHWWATAGLSRTVGRRLGAGDETPGSGGDGAPSDGRHAS